MVGSAMQDCGNLTEPCSVTRHLGNGPISFFGSKDTSLMVGSINSDGGIYTVKMFGSETPG